MTDEVGEMADLDREIQKARQILDALPNGHEDQPQRIRELASLLTSREYVVLPDLVEAIRLGRQAVDMTPQGLRQAAELSHLADLSYQRYLLSGLEKSASGESLDEAIELERSAIDLPSDDQDRAIRLDNLGRLLCCRYRRARMVSSMAAGVRAGKVQVDEFAAAPASCGQSHQQFMAHATIDLDEAIKVSGQAIDIIQNDNPDRPWWLFEVGTLYGYHHDETGAMQDLEDAIRATRQSLAIFDALEPEATRQLGELFCTRYLRAGERSDVELATELARAALADALTATPLADLFGYRHSLAASLWRLHEETGEMGDLNIAIEAAEQTVAEAREDFQRILASEFLAEMLFNRYQKTKTMIDLDQAIEMARKVAHIMYFKIHQGGRRGVPGQFAALLREWWQEDVGVSSHSSDLAAAIEQQACVTVAGSTQIGSLIHLKDLLHTRYERAGETEDLDEAVQVMMHAVGLLPKPSHLLNLGFLLLELYEETLDETVADEAAQISRQLGLVEDSQKGLPQREHLQYLAGELCLRFLVSGNVTHLEEAINVGIQVTGMLSDDEINQGAPLNHLGHPYYLKFCTSRAWNDLDTALKHSRQASAIIEDGANRGYRLCNYSYWLLQRYTHTLSTADLDEAIHVGRQAVDASSHYLHMRERILDKLATALYQRYLATKSVTDLEQAVQLSQQAVERKQEDPINGCFYFVNLAALLCERHVLADSQADLEEAIKLVDLAWDTIEPRQKPHPNLARALCYFCPRIFAHFLGRPQDNCQNRVEECRGRLAGLASTSPVDGARDRSSLALALTHALLKGEPPADLDEPIRLGRDAISMAQSDHPEDVPWHLSCLAFGLRSRYSIMKNPEDLAETITLSARAVDMAPKDHPGRPFYLIVHAIGLYCRYSHTARLLDLYESIRLGLEAWSISSRGDTLADHHNQFWCAGNLALWFTGRYLREGTVSDLERAVEFRQHADRTALILNDGEPIDLYDMHLGTRNTVTPDASDEHIVLLSKEGIPDYPSRLFNVAVEQFKLYSEGSDARDLSSAIFLCGFSVAATPSGHLQRQVRVQFLGKCVMTRYALRGGVNALGCAMAQNESTAEDLDDAISLLQEVVIAASPEHPAWYPSVHSIGPLYMDRYHHSGDLGDLQMALLVLQKSADVTPGDHPLRPSRLRCLGDAKRSSYSIFSRVADLDEAQRLFQEVIDISPHDCPSRAGYLADLAAVHGTKYEDVENVDDLDKSVVLYEDAVKAWPDRDHPAELLSSLGEAYLAKYKFDKMKSGFDKSSKVMHQALERSSPDDQEKAFRLVAVARIHLTGYITIPVAGSLEMATRALQEAADIANRIEQRKSSNFIDLLIAIGNCYRTKYDAARLRSDLDGAVSYLSQAFEQSPKGTRKELVRYIAIAQALSSALILVEDWGEAFEVVSKAIRRIASTIPRFLDISESQACLSMYSGLASDGAALAISAGRPTLDAVRILEEGRAVATAALNQLRIEVPSIAYLTSDKEKELVELCERLELSPFGTSGISNSKIHLQAPHEREGNDLRRAAQRIISSRKLDRFILDYQNQNYRKQTGFPVEVDAGMMDYASRGGHVVIVNVSYRCDAFLIKGYVPQTIPLPKLSRETIQEKVRNRDFTSLEVLEWLWDTIASPVLDALGYTEPPKTSDQWPRIWWIPTGPLSMFPLHAAGRHLERSHQSVIDRVISSYSLSIRALEQTVKLAHREPDRIKAQPHMRRALMVDMEHTPRSTPLPFAGKEVEVVTEACGLMSIKSVRPDQRTRQSVLPLLRDCEIFHFAGHGFTDAVDPSRSHLRLQDWMDNPLTVADMISINLRERKPFLAYLSACGTGQIGRTKHLDENIHLISACQLAGFRHVVGTLCEVNDETCVDIARITYEGIRNKDMTDESVCHGLHNAVRELRDRWRDGLIGKTTRGGNSLSIRTNEVDERGMRIEGQRDAILCDSDYNNQQTVSLQWAPYVHYGC